jgi:hypothetical protein
MNTEEMNKLNKNMNTEETEIAFTVGEMKEQLDAVTSDLVSLMNDNNDLRARYENLEYLFDRFIGDLTDGEQPKIAAEHIGEMWEALDDEYLEQRK